MQNGPLRPFITSLIHYMIMLKGEEDEKDNCITTRNGIVFILFIRCSYSESWAINQLINDYGWAWRCAP